MLLTLLAALEIVSFFITLTLAGYILSRSRFHPLGLATALGLISYALIMMDLYLADQFGDAAVGRILWVAYPLPVALWLRIVFYFREGENLALDRAWWTLVLPITVMFILGGWVGEDVINFRERQAGSLFWLFVAYNIVITAIAAAFTQQIYQATSPQDSMRKPFNMLRVAGAGYLMAMLGLIILPFDIVFPLLVFDVVVMAGVGIIYDALAEGQTVRRDLIATFIKAVFVALVLITPWVLTVDWTLTIGIALFITLGAAALGVTLLDELERLLDKWIYQANSENLARRDALRTLLVNSARQVDNPSPITTLDHDEFVRLTRRALSHMPNLPRLAASPLTNMHLISQRVESDANTLQRANELRQLLAECIENLRPYPDVTHGTTDDWRFYNALYYPYVAGISPYKRDVFTSELDQQMADVVEWFRQAVPPRTLYNWQNRGAELIADILLEQEQQLN